MDHYSTFIDIRGHNGWEVKHLPTQWPYTSKATHRLSTIGYALVAANRKLYKLLYFCLAMAFSNVAIAKEPIHVAIIDTGVNRSADLPLCGNYDHTGKGFYDARNHGTEVARIIVKESFPAEVCIDSHKVVHKRGDGSHTLVAMLAAYKAINPKVRIVNISMAGTWHNPQEAFALKQLTDRGVRVVVAAGNDFVELSDRRCDRYPACYPGIPLIVVGAPYSEGHYSNYGSRVDIIVSGDTSAGQRGTSFAAPRAVAQMVKRLWNQN